MHKGLEGVVEKGLWSWVSAITSRPWISLGLLLIITALAGFTAVRTLSVNTDSTEMIDGSVPFRVNAEAMQNAFPWLKDQILVIIRAETPDEADFTARRLANELRERDDVLDEVFSASVDEFFQRQGLLFLDLGELIDTSTRLSSAGPLLERLIADPSLAQFFDQLAKVELASEEGIGLAMVANAYDEVARLIETANEGKTRPLSWQNMFGEPEQLNQRIILVRPKLDYGALQPAKAAIATVEHEISQLPPELLGATEIYLTGDPVLRSEELKSVSDGIAVSAIVSLLFVALLLTLGLRSWQFVLSALSALLVSLILTAGLAAIMYAELNLVSIAFTVLLIGLGIDFAIHFLLQYREQIDAGVHHHVALKGALEEVGPALGLAAITTCVAFFAFIPTKFDGMAQLGVISGFGVLIAFIVAMTVIPALLMILPTIRPKVRGNLFRFHDGGIVERIAVPVSLLAVVLGLGAAALLPKVHFDADPMHLRDPFAPSVQAFSLLFDRESDTPYRLNYLASDLDSALSYAEKVENHEAVRAAVTLDDFVPKEQDLKLVEIDFLAGNLAFLLLSHNGVEEEQRAAAMAERENAFTELLDLIAATETIADAEADNARGEAAARLNKALLTLEDRVSQEPEILDQLESQVLRFFPMQMERLKQQLTARPVTLDDLPPHIRERYVADDGQVRVEILPQDDIRNAEARKHFVDAVADDGARVSGGALSVLRAGDIVAEAMVQATLTALALAAILIFIMVRRAGFVALVLAPLGLAALLTAAAGVLLDLPFNFANVIVLPLLIGLGVDSSIHLVMRARHLAQGGRGANAVFGTSTPKAVLLSAFTTIGSFGSLALSDHRGTASMGELLMVAIGFTLFATLIVLPGLIELSARANNRRAARKQ